MKTMEPKKINTKHDKRARLDIATGPSSFQYKFSGLKDPSNTKDVNVIRLNGIRYFSKSSKESELRVAPVKYTEEHFNEVDAEYAHKPNYWRACEIVADRYGFESLESFHKQYRKRHLNFGEDQS
jgi:hypothetical protein